MKSRGIRDKSKMIFPGNFQLNDDNDNQGLDLFHASCRRKPEMARQQHWILTGSSLISVNNSLIHFNIDHIENYFYL